MKALDEMERFQVFRLERQLIRTRVQLAIGRLQLSTHLNTALLIAGFDNSPAVLCNTTLVEWR
jgi:hypothetical protein